MLPEFPPVAVGLGGGGLVARGIPQVGCGEVQGAEVLGFAAGFEGHSDGARAVFGGDGAAVQAYGHVGNAVGFAKILFGQFGGSGFDKIGPDGASGDTAG